MPYASLNSTLGKTRSLQHARSPQYQHQRYYGIACAEHVRCLRKRKPFKLQQNILSSPPL